MTSRFRHAAVLVLALALCIGVGCSLASAKTGSPPKVKLNVVKYELPNGLDVILAENHRLPIVGVNVWYHVGPANEEPGRTGFAHLFEHMMFKGSKHVADGKHWTELQSAGATLINGTTDFDRTNYLEDLPSHRLETALWLESDRMGFLLEGVTAVKLANQQDVVRNERRQSTENAEYGIVEEEMFHQLYPKEHPYYAAVIGSHADIQAAKLEDVRAFFQRYYCPNNASIAIVGDIDIAKTKELVAKYFGSIPRGADVPPIRATTPPITSERRATVTDQITLPRVYMAWITPPAFQPGEADGAIAADVLGGTPTVPWERYAGKANRLYRKLVYEQRIAQDVTATHYPALLGSIFQITATAKPGHTAEELEKAIDEELAKLAAEGPTDAEVGASRQTTYSRAVSTLERVGFFNGVADRLNRYNYYLKTPDYLEKDLARYTEVTPATVKGFVSRYLTKNSRVVVYGVPGEKKLGPAIPTPEAPAAEAAAPAAPDPEPWRATPPAGAKAAALQLPAPERFALPNGLTIYHVEDHHLPLVTAGLFFRTGSAADPSDLPGLAGIASAMAEEGTRQWDALALADRLHELGAAWDGQLDVDSGLRRVSCLSANARSAMAVLAEVALHPTFPESELERVRQDRLAALMQEKDSPPAVAERVFLPSLYGPAHPYGHVALGTEAALKKITREDVVRFHEKQHTPKNAALVIVGDIKEKDARAMAAELFGSWSGEAPPPPSFSDRKASGDRVIVVDKPAMPQTRIMVGQVGVARSDPDYDRLSLMNTVMAGGFTSRVNHNLREVHGYTYGTYGSLSENRGEGRIAISGGIRADVTGPALSELFKEVQSMKDQPVTEEELARARGSRIEALPGRFQTQDAVTGQIGSLFTFGLPDDYFRTLPAQLGAITGQDLTDMARKYLTPERMLVVAVGDRAKIQPQIATLGRGTITPWDAGEQVGTTGGGHPGE
jgi:zinc protease